MGITDIIKKWSENKKELKQKFKEAETEQKIQKMLEERQKSSNERELERYVKEEREKKIKSQLDKIHKQQTKEMWKSNAILKKGKSILHDDKKALACDKPILKQKNIFKW